MQQRTYITKRQKNCKQVTMITIIVMTMDAENKNECWKQERKDNDTNTSRKQNSEDHEKTCKYRFIADCQRVFQIYLRGNETRFSQEIPVNASLQAVYIHHVVRDMTYHIEMSAVNRVGEGVRSKAIIVGKQRALLYSSLFTTEW